MAEKIYTIPVNDAFDEHSECPICSMYQALEDDSIDFVISDSIASYMQDDVRMETNKKGFCKNHMKMLYVKPNRLGLALILKTHLDRQYGELTLLKKKPIKAHQLLKKTEEAEVVKWAKEKTCDCYICERIDWMFPHYLDTVIQLYKKDADFKKKYEECNGFCQEHYGMLIEKAQKKMNQKELDEFSKLTTDLYLNNIKRLSEDLDWFCDKFDYRYKDEPWKNSKDSIERAVIKTNGILPEKKKK